MKNWSKHIVANALLVVFVGIILIKPLHLLTSDHHHIDTCQNGQQDGKSHDNCTICQFAFDVSTQPVLTSATIVYQQVIARIKSIGDVTFTNFIVKHTSPRAPPVLVA